MTLSESAFLKLLYDDRARSDIEMAINNHVRCYTCLTSFHSRPEELEEKSFGCKRRPRSRTHEVDAQIQCWLEIACTNMSRRMFFCVSFSTRSELPSFVFNDAAAIACSRSSICTTITTRLDASNPKIFSLLLRGPRKPLNEQVNAGRMSTFR